MKSVNRITQHSASFAGFFHLWSRKAEDPRSCGPHLQGTLSTCYTLRDVYLHCLKISLFFCVCMSYQCLLKTKWAFIWWHQQHGQIRRSLFIHPPQQCAIHHGQKCPCGSCGRNGVSPSPVFGNLGHSCRPCNTSKLAPALLATIWEPLENNVSDSRPQKRAFVEVQLSSRDV